MPQMEFATYAPQLIWLAITFVALYLLMSGVALPRIASVLEARRERIADDLDRAEVLKQAAAEALAAYQLILAQARERAVATASEARARLAAAVAARRAEIERRLAGEAREAERRIAAARDHALASLREVAVEVARTATIRLIGVDPAEQAPAAVERALGDRR